MHRMPARDIICAGCPDIYSEYDITATRGDESKPLVDVLGRTAPEVPDTSPVTKRRAMRRLIGREPTGSAGAPVAAELTGTNLQREKLRNLNRLRDWTFTCPMGHVVDGNSGY